MAFQTAGCEMKKRALVCGAGAGIGRASAIALANQGFDIVALARTRETLEQLMQALPVGAHSFIVADMSKPDMLISPVEAALQTGTIHVLINNTGGPPAGAIASATSAQFLSAFHQHLLAGHTLMQLLLPGMKEAGFGRIVSILSTSVKEPLKDLGVSNTMRAAVASWAKTLAAELGAFGITVNNVLPGFTETDRLQAIIESRMQKSGALQTDVEAALIKEVPAARFAKAEETAAAVAFLCSEAAGYINGVNLPVDGGRTRSL
jgi:3-oxoacyl-[acyl-carrier protein] reductase